MTRLTRLIAPVAVAATAFTCVYGSASGRTRPLATSTSTSTATATATASQTVAATKQPPRCRAVQMRMRGRPEVGGAAGTGGILVWFRNSARSACTLIGYPDLRFYSKTGEPVKIKVVHGEWLPVGPQRVRLIDLTGKHRITEFVLSYDDHPGPAPVSSCQNFYRLGVKLPGEGKWFVAPLQISAEECGGPLDVSPVGY